MRQLRLVSPSLSYSIVFPVLLQGLSIYLFFPLSFSFTLWLAVTANSTYSVGFLFFLLTITLFGHLSEICWSICISKSQRILCDSFSRMENFRTQRTLKKSSEASYHTRKRVLKVLWQIENSLEHECWLPRSIFWRKWTFYSLFLSILVNTTSVSILFEHNSYLKKMNISFMVHFSLGKYSFSLDYFLIHLVLVQAIV